MSFSSELLNTATEIAYEDVQMISSHLFRCATHLLTVVQKHIGCISQMQSIVDSFIL